MQCFNCLKSGAIPVGLLEGDEKLLGLQDYPLCEECRKNILKVREEYGDDRISEESDDK